MLGGLAAVAIVARGLLEPARRRRAARRAARGRLVHGRHLEPRRRRQRLARGDDLLGQGPGGRVRQRLASVTVINRDTDAAGQLADIRDLIAKNVNDPHQPDRSGRAQPGDRRGHRGGIAVVAIDAPVTAAGAYNLSNDQVEYAYLGAKALFEQMGKKGDVVYMRGIAGHQADTDRDTGFKKALAEYPDIKVAKETVTKWDQATAVTQINDILSSGLKFDGIWTSGIDNVIVDALKTANHALVPIVGADNAGFVNQLLNEPGLKGAAVTNPAAVGGAGVALALKLLAGEKPAETDVHVTPELWDNTTEEGKAALTAARTRTSRALAPRAHGQGLDHVHRGRRQRLQGPGRVTRILVRSPVTGMSAPPASPRIHPDVLDESA